MKTRTKAAAALAVGGLGAAGAVAYLLRRINSIGEFEPERHRRIRKEDSNPLLASFPALADRIPWRPLGRFPTPVEELPNVPGTGTARLFVKRDDLSSTLYGGNKVRKLEHLIAEAELSSRRALVTLGGIGSNHALATALHGAALGFDVQLVLYRQPVTPFVRHNLAGFIAAGARIHFGGSIAKSLALAGSMVGRRRGEAAGPYFIMVGGTSRLGCLGHVSAGLELAEQVRQGELPEPDRIYVPLGTCGTAAGLVVGLRLGGLKSRVVAVRVADPFPANQLTVTWLAQDVADFLHSTDPAVPRLRIGSEDLEVRTNLLGPGYGFPTREGEGAVEWARPRLSLETTYTGKTLAACLDDARNAERPETLLFWNTFSSAEVKTSEEFHRLPAAIRELISA